VAAAREAVVSRSTGKNCSRGYKVYRHGVVTGFVPTLDRLAVQQISARFLETSEQVQLLHVPFRDSHSCMPR
jgi:transposase, IS30 family